MTKTAIRFVNSNDHPIYLQVDPWAGLYVLEKDEEIEIVAECESDSPEFRLEEYQDTRILTILHSTDYSVVRNGTPMHWTEYPTNCTR